MIEIVPESQGNMLVVKATEKLTDADYKEVLIPAFEGLVKQFGEIRMVVHLTKDFRGWEPHAAWDDAVFGIKHRNDFEKMAVVGGTNWIEWGTKLARHLMTGEVRTFSDDQLEQALDWIES
jgi:hypothetical protein